MSEIKERLDKVRALIQEPEFLEGKGLSNEVNIRIFCYEPENEMVVRHFVNQLETDQFLDCHLIVCNLYKTFLSICDDMDITDAIPDMEEADGSAYLLEQLNSAIGNGEFIDKIQYEPHEPGDVLVLTGVEHVNRRIIKKKITKGVEIYVRKVAPLGDPVEVSVRGYELSLRKADAEMIEVE